MSEVVRGYDDENTIKSATHSIHSYELQTTVRCRERSCYLKYITYFVESMLASIVIKFREASSSLRGYERSRLLLLGFKQIVFACTMLIWLIGCNTESQESHLTTEQTQATSFSMDPTTVGVETQDSVLNNSIKDLIVQINSNPSDAELRLELAKLYDANGLNDAAITTYRQSINLDEGNFSATYLLAVMLHQMGNFQEAINLAKRARAIEPLDGSLHQKLGEWYIEADELEFAMQNFEVAERLNVGPAAKAGVVKTLIKQGRAQEALIAVNELLEVSQHPVLYRLLSQIHHLRGEHDKAIEATEFVKDSGSYREIWYEDPIVADMLTHAIGLNRRLTQAQQLLSEQRLEEAISSLTSLAQEFVNNHEVHYQLGLAYMQSQSYQEATQSLLRVIEIEPVHYPSHLLLASIYQSLENNQAAEQHLLRVIKIFPRLHIAHQELAFVQLRLGLKDEALASFKNAIAYDSVAPNVFYYTGVLLGERNQCEEALEYFHNTLVFDEKHVKAHIGLATCYTSLSKQESAIEFQEKAQKLLRQQNNP